MSSYVGTCAPESKVAVESQVARPDVNIVHQSPVQAPVVSFRTQWMVRSGPFTPSVVPSQVWQIVLVPGFTWFGMLIRKRMRFGPFVNFKTPLRTWKQPMDPRQKTK